MPTFDSWLKLYETTERFSQFSTFRHRTCFYNVAEMKLGVLITLVLGIGVSEDPSSLEKVPFGEILYLL